VDLFAIQDSEKAASLSESWRLYGEALQCFEDGQNLQAAEILGTLESAMGDLPYQFLNEQLERALNRELRRRSTDKPAAERKGVVKINAK
jgi:hypothetical protein